MPIFDKDSEINRSGGSSVIKGEYKFTFDDENEKSILKMFHVSLDKDQVVNNHSHNMDVLNIVNDGAVEVTEKNKKPNIYNKGDWYVTKKGTIYKVKALYLTTMCCSHSGTAKYQVQTLDSSD